MKDKTYRALLAHNICGRYSRTYLKDLWRRLSPHIYGWLHWTYNARAEAVIWGVQNFNEVREMILSMVRSKPLFITAQDISLEILEKHLQNL